MGWYDDRRAGHGYFTVHDEVASLLARLSAQESTPLKVDFAQMWAVLSTVRTRIDQVPAAFIPIPMLSTMQNDLASIRDGLSQLEGDGTEELARNVLARLDEFMLRAMAVLSVGAKPEETSEAIRKAVQGVAEERERLRSNVDLAVAELRSIRDEAQRQIATERQAVADEIAARRGELASAETGANDLITQRLGEFQVAVESATNQVNQQVLRLDAAVTDHGDRFSVDQEERRKQFGDAQSKWDADAETERQKFRDEAAPLISYLDERAEAARSIVAATAAESTAGQYLTAEDRERDSADRWRNIGLAVLVAAAIAGTVIAGKLGPKPGDGWEAIAAYYVVKSPVAALFVYMGIYALRQSAGHRERATRYGRVARELSVFRPFIDELDSEPKQREISEATKRYFPGQTMERASALDVPLPPPTR